MSRRELERIRLRYAYGSSESQRECQLRNWKKEA